MAAEVPKQVAGAGGGAGPGQESEGKAGRPKGERKAGLGRTRGRRRSRLSPKEEGEETLNWTTNFDRFCKYKLNLK